MERGKSLAEQAFLAPSVSASSDVAFEWSLQILCLTVLAITIAAAGALTTLVKAAISQRIVEAFVFADARLTTWILRRWPDVLVREDPSGARLYLHFQSRRSRFLFFAFRISSKYLFHDFI